MFHVQSGGQLLLSWKINVHYFIFKTFFLYEIYMIFFNYYFHSFLAQVKWYDLKCLIEVLDFMHAGWHLLGWHYLLSKLFLKLQVIILLLMESRIEWRLDINMLSLTSILLLLIVFKLE